MRKLSFVFILVALCLPPTGCRTDKGSARSSELDSRNGAPAPEAPQPSAAEPPAPADPAPAPATSATANANDPRPLIVCFGDSLTAGFGTEAGQTYPDYLQSSLDAQGYHYRVVNQGISGNTTKDGISRLDTILALHPAVIIVEFGGNDGLRGLPISDSRVNLDKIVSTLKASGAKIVLAGITLPPDYGPDYIQQFDATYSLLAKKYRVPLIPFILQGVFGTPGMMQRDRTHATAAGNKLVAQNILPYIQPLIKK
ncbi:arylesterase [Granulicella sp. dw_53]|uniref:arylesterase n=1 Tax=Granulicella sp. dw_53 TaxID=2719792 RepID=UPI001BD65640|nr:arylesterase [Granulicella sp. dw_53]